MPEGAYIDSDGAELTVYKWDNWDRNGTQFRYYNPQNQRHRLDGPAVENANGYKEWWQNGNLHRLDGPAREHPGIYKEWFVDGERVDPQVLVAYWLERGRCCWYDESTQELRFGDV